MERQRWWSKDIRLLACCDGLLLICYAEETHYQLLICNPITGSHTRLPIFRPSNIQDFRLRIATIPYEWAIVRSASIGQYKVFAIEKLCLSQRKCYVFELPRGRRRPFEHDWKELEVPLPKRWLIEASTTVRGKVCWLSTKLDGEDYHQTVKLLSIDILNEEFRTTVSVRTLWPLGHYFASSGTFYCTQQWDGQLRLWILDNFDDPTWVEHRGIHSPDHPVPLEHAVVLGGAKLIMGFNCLTFMFDMISKEFKPVGLGSDCSLISSAKKALPFVSSLVSCG
ncbi:uncharacterized protein LOC116187278 [Punica granatum]|uniref:Uncharacterized protein LOC116187278 n=1 Tax=Punica granatum TaxID=22663 RepID=A0A218XE20_PUNGR|nr:uncharacterized protein LOC116187278 [Punica granatum]OWM82939.1 hypothetical protein CDL15_Pgr005339 [Punica granatum]